MLCKVDNGRPSDVIIDEFCLFSERHVPEIMERPHWHSHVELNLLSRGRFTYLLNGELIDLEAGHVGVFWAATPHQVMDVDGAGTITIICLPLLNFLQLPLPDAFRQHIMSGGFVRAKECDPVDPLIFERWHRNLFRADPRLERLVLEEVGTRVRRMAIESHVVISGQSRATSQRKGTDRSKLDRVRRMTDFVARRFSEPMTVEMVAEAADLHPNYAMNLFRKVVGMTINQYINRQRLSRAQALLIATEMKVLTIALSCGFGSLSRFYEVFNRQFGLTPSQYRAAFNALLDENPVGDSAPLKARTHDIAFWQNEGALGRIADVLEKPA